MGGMSLPLKIVGRVGALYYIILNSSWGWVGPCRGTMIPTRPTPSPYILRVRVPFFSFYNWEAWGGTLVRPGVPSFLYPVESITPRSGVLLPPKGGEGWRAGSWLSPIEGTRLRLSPTHTTALQFYGRAHSFFLPKPSARRRRNGHFDRDFCMERFK